jgi:hypothetical protein
MMGWVVPTVRAVAFVADRERRHRLEETTVNRLTLTTVAATAATALAGGAVMPAAGSGGAATAQQLTHTTRLVSLDIESHGLSAHTFAGAAVDRHAGHIVGYDTFTGHFYPRQGRADIWATYALRDGAISVVVHTQSPGSVFGGRILNGTGKYSGVRGTVAARPAPHNPDKTFITLTYHF